MARNIYGLDLGTYEIKIFDKKKVRIWREKNVIAMKDKKYIFSVGNEAYKMYEKAPENVEILFPMKNGVIARFDDMQYLLGESSEDRSSVCPWSGICDRSTDRCDGSGKESVL